MQFGGGGGASASSSGGNIGPSAVGSASSASRNKAEMEKQRKEALQTAAAFLNPQKKPAPRVTPSSSAEGLTASTIGKEGAPNGELGSNAASGP